VFVLMFAIDWMLKYLIAVDARYLRSQMSATAEPLISCIILCRRCCVLQCFAV